jgi:hypothetical protein
MFLRRRGGNAPLGEVVLLNLEFPKKGIDLKELLLYLSRMRYTIQMNYKHGKPIYFVEGQETENGIDGAFVIARTSGCKVLSGEFGETEKAYGFFPFAEMLGVVKGHDIDKVLDELKPFMDEERRKITVEVKNSFGEHAVYYVVVDKEENGDIEGRFALARSRDGSSPEKIIFSKSAGVFRLEGISARMSGHDLEGFLKYVEIGNKRA